MRRALVVLSLVALLPVRANAQLRDAISQLFIFGPGQEPLFLAGSGDPNNPLSLQLHGKHFIPSASMENGSVIGFLTDAIGANVANVPISATSSGVTFRFEGGVPVKTSTSAGPIFAERAQTLGRGRVLMGLNRTSLNFKTLRGVRLDNLNLNFTHENVDFAGCDTVVKGDCSKMGLPLAENDIIQFHLQLDMRVHVTSVYLTYGLFDRMDVSAVLPFVQTEFHGSSDAQIIPFGPPPVLHYFAGTADDPVLSASRESNGTSFGIGDIAARVKFNVRQTTRTSVALLGDARFPTGAENDLLGSGAFAGRLLALLSSQFGDFTPHVNVGYLMRAGNSQNDAVLGTVGFDQLMSANVTMAADVQSEWQVGASRLALPKPVHYDYPYQRTVLPTPIPNSRDDIVNGSFGFKFVMNSGVTAIVNGLFPLNQGGLRSTVTYTAGIEYAW